MNKTIIALFTLLVLGACASKKDIVYFNELGKGEKEMTASYEPKIQIDDELSVIVSAENPELTAQFNLPFVQQNYDASQTGQGGIRTYLVDKNGQIDFPGLGRISVAGKTRLELTDELSDQISRYIKTPIVNVRILNFKYTVVGEVMRPGTFANKGERVTLLEAISSAGDLTIYGNRSNVLVIREMNGKQHYERINLTSSDFLQSDFYYLQQNDVVYVEPNKTRVNSSTVGPNVTVWLSIASIIISILVLTTR